MAVCLGCYGRVGVSILTSRLSCDPAGRIVQQRITECPRCGVRLQLIVDEGPTSKRYIAGYSDSLRLRRGIPVGSAQRSLRERQRRGKAMSATRPDDARRSDPTS